MYGYVRPCRSELKVREAERYTAAYCGLCHALGRRCGPLARLSVSYDVTFLAMLLSDGSEKICERRCVRHPFRKKRCLCGGAGFEKAADYGVIFQWWKLQDERQDERGGKRLLAHVLSRLFRRAYRAAAAREAAFDRFTRERLEELSRMEKERRPSLDAPADCFARILAECSEGAGETERRRCLREILYHVGRSIYILDAIDDREEDEREGRYNALLLRYEDWDGETEEKLRDTLNLSAFRARSALMLLPENVYTPILDNILSEGLPLIGELVLRGEWKNSGKHLRKNKETQWSDAL